MEYEKEKMKAAKLERELARIRIKLNKRRAELRAKELERRKKEFDRMPEELRTAFESVGWSPYQDGATIRRTCGKITTQN